VFVAGSQVASKTKISLHFTHG